MKIRLKLQEYKYWVWDRRVVSLKIKIAKRLPDWLVYRVILHQINLAWMEDGKSDPFDVSVHTLLDQCGSRKRDERR